MLVDVLYHVQSHVILPKKFQVLIVVKNQMVIVFVVRLHIIGLMHTMMIVFVMVREVIQVLEVGTVYLFAVQQMKRLMKSIVRHQDVVLKQVIQSYW